MKRSPARILAVTAGLAAGGALFGALAGAVAVTILMAFFGFNPTLLLEAGRMGAAMGAVLLPIAGWTLLRRVPLWRTLTGTIVGTVIGSIRGTVIIGFGLWPVGMMIGPPLGAICGFLFAAIRLRRRFPAVREAEAKRIEVPRRVDY